LIPEFFIIIDESPSVNTNHMQKSVAQKMGVKAESRTYFQSAPVEALQAIELPTLMISKRLTGTFDYIHFFALSQAGMIERLPALKKHLHPQGTLWVSWPKNRQLDTDLTIKDVIRIGYDIGLVESTALSVDTTWSALKFTFPKKGKVYNNSYGTLKDDDV
jgi:hypothetical protein